MLALLPARHPPGMARGIIAMNYWKVACAAAIVTLSGTADASVRFTFTGVGIVGTGAFGGGPVSGSFSVVLPDFITTNQFVGSVIAVGTTPDYCMVNVGTGCGAFLAIETNTGLGFGPGDKVFLRSDNSVIGNSGTSNESRFTFSDNAFNAFGTYTSTGVNVGTLVVSDAGAVPEPTTWAMMLVGFGLLGGAVRRQRAVALA